MTSALPIVCAVAFSASALTVFSGFGLGTLLLPALLFFLPADLAVAATAVVHLLNNVFKLLLFGRHADRGIVVRFGVPAVPAAVAGSLVLVGLSEVAPIVAYRFLGFDAEVTPVKLVMGVLIVLFAALETVPRMRTVQFGREKLPIGGVVSGFFGGLSGHQGAFRSAFLVRTGLSGEAFVGTGVVIACLVDLTRLGTYAGHVRLTELGGHVPLLAAATVSAFAGVMVGRLFLRGATNSRIRVVVAVLLVLVGTGVAAGIF